MSDDLDTLIAQALAAAGTPPINLGDTGAVYDIVGRENGGSGNDLGLMVGLGEELIYHAAFGSEAGTAVWGSLVTVGAVDGSFELTSTEAQSAIGVVATLDGIPDQTQGLVQTDGMAYVLVASPVARGDRVRASATQGMAETSPFGLGAFGTARTDSDGTGVWVFLTIGDDAIVGSTFVHRSLRDVPGLLRHVDLVEGSTVEATGLFTGGGEQIDPRTVNDHDASAASALLYNSSGTRWAKIDLGAFAAYNGIKAAGFRARLRSTAGAFTATVELKGNTVDDITTASVIATATCTLGASGGTGVDNEALVAPAGPYRYLWLDLGAVGDRFFLHEWSVLEAAGVSLPVADPTTGGGGYLDTVLANVTAAIVAMRWEPMTNGDATSPEIVFAGGDVVMVFVPA